MYKQKGWSGRKLAITLTVLLVLGAAAAIWFRRGHPGVGWTVIAADILFAQASAILLWGVVLTLGNVRMFTSMTYGFKQLHRVLQNRVMKSSVMKEDYLTYRESRPVHGEARPLLIIGGAWLALALIAALLA